jgi:hypothetical protein
VKRCWCARPLSSLLDDRMRTRRLPIEELYSAHDSRPTQQAFDLARVFRFQSRSAWRPCHNIRLPRCIQWRKPLWSVQPGFSQGLKEMFLVSLMLKRGETPRCAGDYIAGEHSQDLGRLCAPYRADPFARRSPLETNGRTRVPGMTPTQPSRLPWRGGSIGLTEGYRDLASRAAPLATPPERKL